MEEASTASCAEALLSSWISQFGVPDSITMDRGSAFLSELWVSLACQMGTTLLSTTAYNPAANDMVERAHCSLKPALMARCTDKNWSTQLPWVLLGLRTPHRGQMAIYPHRKSPIGALTESSTRIPKAYLIDVHGWEDWVSIHRLKPAFLLDSEIREEAGRHPRVPVKVCLQTYMPPH
ncbi:uncharacterized protein [Macrobrachium rosenbergii]|uniref:uncharacterized protein n=1 Tax=Macrobrachium rosenbergii TaxID=79674 RepID=UPI0034D6D64C